MTKPKYKTLEDVPKFQHFGKKRYPIPLLKRTQLLVTSLTADSPSTYLVSKVSPENLEILKSENLSV